MEQPTSGATAPVAPRPAALRPSREGRAWRLAFAAPSCYLLGSALWLIGAGLACGAYTRALALNAGGGVQTASGVLYILACVTWGFGALVSILAAQAEAVALRVGGRAPGIARLVVLCAWLELLAAVLLLIGAAIYTAADEGRINAGTTGGILFLLGAFVLLMSQSMLMVVALVVGSVTSLMPDMALRQRAWCSIASQLLFLLGLNFFVLGAIAYVLQSLGLYGSILWLVASATWLLAFSVRMAGTWHFFVPLMAFAAAAAATTTTTTTAAALAGGTSGGACRLGGGRGGLSVVCTCPARGELACGRARRARGLCAGESPSSCSRGGPPGEGGGGGGAQTTQPPAPPAPPPAWCPPAGWCAPLPPASPPVRRQRMVHARIAICSCARALPRACVR